MVEHKRKVFSMNKGISGYLMLVWGHSPLILNFNSTFFLRGHVIENDQLWE